MALLFLILVALLGIVPQTMATDYYASPSGPGSGSCTSGSPCSVSFALSNAGASDRVILKNGTYTAGPYTLSSNGNSSNRITFMAENRHQAIIEGNCGNGPSGASCSSSNSNEGLRITGDWWWVEGIWVRAGSHNIDVASGAANVIIHDILNTDFRERGISIEGDNVTVQNSVIGYYQDDILVDPTDGIRFNSSASGAQILSNVITSINNDGNVFMNSEFGGDGHTSGISIHIGGNIPQVIMRGNIIMWGSKDGVRIFDNCRQQVFTDNVCAYATAGCWSARDTHRASNNSQCFPGNHNMSNNFLWAGATAWGGKGAHSAGNSYHHNTVILTKFTNEGGMRSVRNSGEFDEDQSLRSNLFYNDITPSDGSNRNGYLGIIFNYGEAFGSTPNNCGDGCGSSPPSSSCGCKTHNLYWWNWSTSTNNWLHVETGGSWSYGTGEIASFNSQPVFVNPAEGDYTLASGSPGKNGAHDGTDIGIAFNAFLTPAKIKAVTTLPIHEVGTSGTSASISGLNASNWYSVYTRHPESNPCSDANEVHTIEGRNLKYVNYTTNGEKWRGVHFPHGRYSGGSHRWMHRGEHAISSDGVLNVGWQTSSCVDRIAAIEVPTPQQASCWVNPGAAGCSVGTTPTGLTAQAGANFGEILVSWNGVTGASGYRLYVATESGGSYSLLSSPTGTTVLHTGLGDGVQRCYVVAAVVDGEESQQSNEACGSTRSSPPYLINAGGNEYTDTAGNTWVADRAYTTAGYGYVGGTAQIVSTAISGTTDDALYQSERWGHSAYRFTVPNSNYDVTLHFAEIFATSVGQRVFDVSIEGAIVLDNLDIFAEVGSNTALTHTFSSVAVTDGVIDIEFVASANSPQIAAIFITDAGGPVPTLPSRFINAGGLQHVDGSSVVWEADRAYEVGGYGFVGGNANSTTDAIAGTTEDPLFQTERWDLSAYRFDLPSGDYDVTLHFAENFHTSVGARVFDAVVEGQFAQATGAMLPPEHHQTDFLTITDCQGANLGTTFYPTASASEREACRDAVNARNYTDWYLSIVSGDHNHFGNVSGFRALLTELINDGIRPVVWLTSDTGAWKDQAVSTIQTALNDFIPQIDDLVSSYVLGIEIEEYWSSSESNTIAGTMQGLTTKPIGFHQGPGLWAYCDASANCDYMVLQYGFGLSTSQITAMTEDAIAELGPSKPVVAGEYNLDGSESLSISLGNAGVTGGAQGFGNGGTAIGGSVTSDNLDIFAEVGHDAALTLTAENVSVSDGTLDITFSATTNFPKISAIGITPVGGVVEPDAPTSLSVTSTAGSGEANLAWTGTADTFTVYRSTTEGGPYTLIDTTAANTYDDGTVINGTTYYYVVTATVGGVESDFSNEDSVTPTSGIDATLTGTSNQFYHKHRPHGIFPLADVNGDVRLPATAVFTWRGQIQATGEIASARVYELAARRDGGAWTTVTDDCSIGSGTNLGICYWPHRIFDDGDSLSNVLPLGGGITYQEGGVFRESGTPLPSLSIDEARAIELAFSLAVSEDATVDTIFELRLQASTGTPLGAYDHTPAITVIPAVAAVSSGVLQGGIRD